MPQIPAVCLDPLCNTVFPSGFALEGECRDITMSECLSGPCPKCGGQGKIPDGNYNSIHNEIFAALFNISDVSKLVKIKKVLKTAKENMQFKESLENTAPELKNQLTAIDWAKENQVILDLIIKFITVLIVVLTYLKLTPGAEKPSHQTIINQTYYQFYNPSVPMPNVLDLADNKTSQKKLSPASQSKTP